MKEKIISNGKLLGVVEDKVYTSHRYPHHFMIKFMGFGISLRVLKRLQELEVDKIVIIYKTRGGEDMEYTFHINEYLESELEYNNNGDVQKFVSVKGGKKQHGNDKRTGTGVHTTAKTQKHSRPNASLYNF